ncbi:sensor histidine kinase [Thalassotalea euphylliae]|uniref:histidine kinase n=1 Tax=Thalassotalea euphylliae TaxID=1655234 RepID=A0A3E0TMP4_9GAMM|nr:HAMP domain-containing sensor histidine kinase [Thalassotalea euphylliae]REL25617.1 sensor histidine kinase [Thalassotalea euphylliae]
MTSDLPVLAKLRRSASQLSIKHLAVLGFFSVIGPLFAALLYIAEQTKAASSLGVQSILAVSTLVKANQDLSQTLTRAERFASQFMVLKEIELLDRFTVEHFKAVNILETQLAKMNDEQLDSSIASLNDQLSELAQQLPREFQALEQVATAFRQMVPINQAIRARSDQLIQLKAHAIRDQTESVDVVIYQSLLIVPISLLIAIFFVYLINRPLRRITGQIDQLSQDNFEHAFELTGPKEISNIARALETMRVRLRALELQKSSFIRHISHELKTPLAAIREGSALLNDNSLGALNAGQKEVSGIIINNVNRLQQLIEDLLAFNIVLDSTSLQDRQTFLIAPVIETVVKQHKLALQKKGLSVELALADATLKTNQKQLSVVIENLLSNAIKYTNNDDVIKISAAVKDQQLQLSVSDHGPGMSQQECTHIFDAFYQGKLATANGVDSSGLGLTIVQELVMRLSGTIDVQSNQAKQTHGTTFIVKLPSLSAQEA